MGKRQLLYGCLLLIVSFAASQVVSKCKSTQILTENKGCVDRDTYLERVLLRTWVAEDLDGAKKAAGLGKTVNCKPDEVLTATGCTTQTEAPRQAEVFRVPVSHSKLQGDQVVKSDAGGGGGAADSAGSPEARDAVKAEPRTDVGRPRVVGHNRPRKFVILPGRILKAGRKCRPYEIQAADNRCIRKRVQKPTGKVKHKEHVYGLQLRHRHKNAKQAKKSKNRRKNKADQN